MIGGVGLIENDFHKRKDLSPNVCALFVEKAYRNNGIAGALLEHVCKDTAQMGYQSLYLITNHDQLYEKFGWSYLCMVEEDNKNMIRMCQRELSSFLESIPT